MIQTITEKQDFYTFVQEIAEETIKNLKEKKSPAQGPTSIKTTHLEIKGNHIQMTINVMDAEKNIIFTHQIDAPNVLHPYFNAALVKILIECYWSGTSISKRNKRRFQSLLQYGDKNAAYLDRSLRKVYIVKQLFPFKR